MEGLQLQVLSLIITTAMITMMQQHGGADAGGV